ncbi:hypothetical protein O0L34_g13518 [Tuta absoluta]|nr:hypothetical protein O0L34_g13518 [Tuta absoluta]
MPKIGALSPSGTQSHSTPELNLLDNPELNKNNPNRQKRFRPDFSPPNQNDNEENLDISNALAKQTSILSQLQADIAEIKIQNATIKESNAKIEESMTFINRQYDDLKIEVQSLKKERMEQKLHIEYLENKLQDLQLRSRTSSIEVRNMPTFKNNETSENLKETVCSIGETVGLNISPNDFRDVYRLPEKSDKPRPVVAEFTSVEIKTKLLSAVQIYNRGKKDKNDKLNTEQIGIQGARRPIYVSEQITGSTKKLFYQSRIFAKENNYTFCWISNGNIFLRKGEGDKQLLIKSEQCLLKLLDMEI